MSALPVTPYTKFDGIAEDALTMRKLRVNYDRNKEQDHTALLDQAAAAFRYDDCKDQYWNPEEFSFLYGTPLWNQATEAQRVLLNQLYWVAYYSQIISAEIATIFYNQTSAAGLYGLEDFRLVCDTLDLESSQERAHIAAFRTVADQVEKHWFDGQLFMYPMRSPYAETTVFVDTGPFKRWWKGLQLRSFGLLSSGNAFIACQYFTVRGIRTLNGKIVQHQLSRYYAKHPDKDNAPIPSKISYYHYMDESYHFNSSHVISHDVVRSLKDPTAFERMVCNMSLWGTQKDHAGFSAAINGLFWHDPALLDTVATILRLPIFGLEEKGIREMMWRCFGEENDAVHASYKTHRTAVESYRQYLADLPFVNAANKEMRLMERTSIDGYLAANRKALRRRYAA